MLGTQTRAITQDPAGILAPARVLRWHQIIQRLRPVRLGVMIRELNKLERMAKGLRLLNHYFPGSLGAFSPAKHDWDDLLREFLHLVEDSGWLPIDWATLDDFFNWWMMGDDDSGEDNIWESDGAWYIAAYLNGIPLRTWGWGEEQRLNEDAGHWRVILSGIIAETEMSAEVIMDLEIYEVLQDVTLDDIWDRLHNADFSGYDEPLCWLPSIACICAGSTGNEILDTGIDFSDVDPERWTWAGDLDRLRALWAEAKPLAEKYDKFDEWMFGTYDDDERRRRLEQMVLAVLGVEVVDDATKR